MVFLDLEFVVVSLGIDDIDATVDLSISVPVCKRTLQKVNSKNHDEHQIETRLPNMS